MDFETLKTELQRLTFAADLPDTTLERLAEIATLSAFSAGTHLFSEGGRNDRLLLLISGSVALDMRVPGRGSVRILTVGAGDMLAWSALFGGGEMTATATAMDDVRAVSTSGEAILALSETDHEFGYRFMRRMAEALSRRLLATRLQLLDLFADTRPDLVRPAGVRS